MNLKTLTVEHSTGSYPIYIGSDLYSQKQLWKSHIHGSQVLVVTNETLAPLFLSSIVHVLSDWKTQSMVLPDGEQFKTLTQWELILNNLIENHHHRDTTLIALGGGVIGDLTGFAAACFHRGVNFIQVPTSLLAQVDASIGGKTAVNHSKGKNLIGAFYPPQAVIIDVNSLNTLPDREFRAGLAEIIKVALIADADFFAILEKNLASILTKKQETLISVIEHACRIKRDIVTRDEKEHGIRAYLNFGHTYGHAMEYLLNYRGWLHGEAVAWGMLQAARLSLQLKKISHDDFERVINLLTRAGLNIAPPQNFSKETILEAMSRDKKILKDRLRLIALEKIGSATILEPSREMIIQSLGGSHEL